MRYIIRWAGLLSLLLLTITPALAQGSESIDVIGSGIVNPLMEALAQQAEQESLEIRTVGSATGIDKFCNGDIDLATAIRPMSAAERAICGSNDVAYSELLIGHRILAFITHPDAPLECLSESQAQAILKPSASGAATDWSVSGETENDLPLSLILPPNGHIEFTIADGLVPGDGLRRDARTYQDANDALAIVGETEGALALVGWHESLDLMDSIALLEYGSGELGECALPSAENVEQEKYSAALSMYVYVNRLRMASNQQVFDLMQFVTDEANQALIRLSDVTPPSDATYELNVKLLADDASSAGVTDFLVPSGLSGSVTIVGAANAANVMDRVASALSQNNASLEIVQEFAGRANGLAALCRGEADIALVDADLTDGDLEACTASGIATVPTKLGSLATILIGNAADEHARCLSANQINTIWRAESAEMVLNWSDVDPSFPDLGMTLFGMSLLDQTTDILLQTAGQVIPPIRRDTERDFNPLYRAAAVGNVPGALTYMDWTDYQRVLDNGQADIQVVEVDAGGGCVAPSSANIDDGSYALSRPASLLIRQESLSDISAQSFLWTLFDGENWPNVEQEGFVGLAALDLPRLRLELQGWFAEAEALFSGVDDVSEPAGDSENPEDDSG